MNRTTFADVLVTSHELATQAGMEIFALGGNAVDAAVAANACLGVVAPETCGIGGDLFALIFEPGTAEPLALNASGWAGSNVSVDHLNRNGTIPITDPASVTIPGCVRGWEALLDRSGSLPLSAILQPALRMARSGFPVSAELADSLHRRSDQLAPQLTSQSLYPDGSPPRAGTWIDRPLLGATLDRIAGEGSSAFYGGSVADDISNAVDGFITHEDLAAYQPDWVEPLSLDVFGHRGWTMPPNSQGYLTLAASKIFERCDPPKDPSHPAYVHLAIEAYRSVAASRDDLLADPSTAAGRDELIGDQLLTDLAGQIDRRRAGRWPVPRQLPGGTTYLAAVDRTGLGISLIQSNFHGIGSGIGAGRSGFFLHNRGAGFALQVGHRNELRPGRRPAHTLAPTIWTRDDQLALVLGTRGGHQQPQLLLQMAAHLLHAGMTPDEAQNHPRWTTDSFGAGSSSAIAIEDRYDTGIATTLSEYQHSVTVSSSFERGWGPVAAITIDASGLRTGAADPRVRTASSAVR